ncbi:MAG: hypothetical protein AB7N76_34550 [Planctomycetota bacterium]
MSRIASLALTLVLCLTAAAGAQERGREPGYAGNLGRFGGAIVLSDAAKAAARRDVDALGDALREPANPEFLANLALFDGALRGGEALAARTPGLAGKLGTALKHNLVLAGALTATSAVDIDLNGFSLSDAVHGDFSDLRGARVGLNGVRADDLAITMGTFAVAQPVWAGVKRVGLRFAGLVAKRFLRTAAIKAGLAVAPVPGSRVVALGLTLIDVGLAVVDLAGLLTTASAIEAPVRAANDRRVRAGDRRGAEEAARQAARRGDPAALQAALDRVAAARARERDLAYLPLARQDLALVRRLRERGEDPAALSRVAGRALDDYGPGLALPAQSALLLEEYERRAAAGDAAAGADAAALARHRERLQREAAAAAAARDQSYAQEDAFYRGLLGQVSDPALREAIAGRQELSQANAYVERQDLRPRLSGAARPAGSAPQQRDTTQRRGMTDAFGQEFEE